ncbi:MAG: hypothetical protein M4579_007285 [Chaenotheca gracillima]|nr:MAG: hypothetical protein M4579_007285 [Chaenotheca gracillima]
MDWSPDYCLSCDNQTSRSDSAYCSQACRLADLAKGHTSPSSSSSSSSSPLTSSNSWPSSPTAHRGFYLPPPLNFAALRSQSSAAPARTSPTWQNASSGLTTSTSQSSLASIQSYASSSGSSSTAHPTHGGAAPYISEKARRELSDYARNFDQVRDWKRRVTMT